MNANALFLALNEVESAFIKEAEEYSAPKKRGIIGKIVPIAAAACLCLGIAAAFLWKPTTPALTFSLPPADSVSGGSSYALAGPENGETRELAPEEIASIWGEEALSWEGVDPYKKYLIKGTVTLENGKIWEVEITGYLTEELKQNSMEAFSIRIRPDMIPPQCCTYLPDFHVANEMWGTPVSTLAEEGGRGFGGKGEPGSYYSDTKKYSAEFLREGTEAVGFYVQTVADDAGLTEEEAKDLVTRITSQSLRPETTLAISHLTQTS